MLCNDPHSSDVLIFSSSNVLKCFLAQLILLVSLISHVRAYLDVLVSFGILPDSLLPSAHTLRVKSVLFWQY